MNPNNDEDPQAASANAGTAPRKPPDGPQRSKRDVGTVVALLVSIIAVVISLLAYFDQHSADQAASILVEESSAAKVGFWLVASNPPSEFDQVAIENDGVLPIANVRLIANGVAHDQNQDTDYVIVLPENTLPPCTVYTAAALQQGYDYVINSQHVTTLYGMQIEYLEFTDPSGVTWTRSSTGVLTRGAINQASLSSALNVPAVTGNTVTAPGCS
jgi:hypothetical protein